LEKVENYEIELGHPFMDPAFFINFKWFCLRRMETWKKW